MKRLVQMHGGEVTARSQTDGPDHGSTFEIRLPLVERPSATAGEILPIKPAPLRILIVDDNADSAKSLALLLQLEGHDAESVLTGREALERVQSFKPNVMLLDLGLPEMNGYEVARRIRAIPDLNGVRLIALTGYGQAEDRQRTQGAGFDDHLVKPVELPMIERTMAGIARTVDHSSEPGESA